MNRFFRVVLFASAAIIGGSATASASSMTIGGLNSTCATCQGSSYTLDISQAPTELNSDNLLDTYLVTLTIDTSGYNGGGTRIDEVAVKVSSGVDVAQLSLAPGGTNSWALVPGGISASGCSGSGSGFECADWKANSPNGAFIPNLSQLNPYLLTWQFTIDIAGPLFSFTSTNPDLLPSIKARYVDDAGNKVGALVSEKVPEPGTLALLGLGASLAAIRRRRDQR